MSRDQGPNIYEGSETCDLLIILPNELARVKWYGAFHDQVDAHYIIYGESIKERKYQKVIVFETWFITTREQVLFNAWLDEYISHALKPLGTLVRI